MKQKRILAFFLTVAVLLTGFPGRKAQAAQFRDISGHWAYEYIIRATDLGFFSGTSKTTFSPDMTMTRAMFVTVLASCSGENISSYQTTRFKDVPSNSWYAHAVAWAYEKGITSGISKNAFGPNLPVARQQIAVMMIQFSNYQQVTLPRTRKAKLFSDSKQCADFALDAVHTLYRAGIISGVGNSKFNPTGNATRAQAAVILCKYADIKSGKVQNAEKIPLISHRGYNYAAPENTMPAFQLAVQKGYKMIETDVQFSKDGVPVLIHDDTIDRTSNGSGKVSQMTYNQLRAYDYSYIDNWSYPAYQGTTIPSFEEFIAFCSKNDIHAFIELKSTMTNENVKVLLNIASKYEMQNEITWISFQYNNLKYVKSNHPRAALGLLIYSKMTANDLSNAALLKNTVNTVSIGMEKSIMTPEVCAKCMRNNIPFYVWTVNVASRGIVCANTGSEYITTNNLLWSNLYS